MRTKHTEGPWIFNELATVLNDETNEFVALISVREAQTGLSLPSQSERTANGNLIAAAPDLLDALKSIRDQDPQKWAELLGVVRESAEAAITKAEGHDA